MNKIREKLNKIPKIPKEKLGKFFKIKPGEYAAHDKFIGITVPELRKIAKEFHDLSFKEIENLITSEFNEERQLALFVLTNRYKKSSLVDKEGIYNFYLKHLKYVNNWNLVDVSAHLILGEYLLKKNKDILYQFAHSDDLWKKRVSIVATWYFIKNHELKPTFKIAKILLNDEHDLIHKAVGWMLREAGKIDKAELIEFLNSYSKKMPRTMLRYAIEKFSTSERKYYLNK